MANDFLATIMPVLIPWLKMFGLAFICVLVLVLGFLVLKEMKKRRWRVEIHEQKADGRIHSVGYDTLVEKKFKMGTKTIYWMRKAKTETIPPPWETVDRIGKKEEVDYLRVARDLVPLEKNLVKNYYDPEYKKKVISAHDKIREKIRSIKTTFFDSDAVRDRFIYIPMNKTLVANMKFTPIDYDMNMMAMNEINHGDEFFQAGYEFWKKYGAVIVFGVTIIFLIILIVLTYDYILDVVTQIMGKTDKVLNLAERVAQGIDGASRSAKPPG